MKTSVDQSTTEADFAAFASCVSEATWLGYLLSDLDVPVERPIKLLQDNLGEICWTEHVQGLRKVKHVGIKYHAIS